MKSTYYVFWASICVLFCTGMFQNAEANVPVTVPATERAALIALYNSTDGDNWFNNNGWKTAPLADDGFAMPGTEQNWYGIICNDANTTVEWIDMDNNNLNGPLPTEIGNLSNLEVISFYDNNLSGSLPDGLGNLNNLIVLDLRINDLSGPIPSWIGGLSALSELYLGANHFTGAIPAELGNLSELLYLSLQENTLTGSIPGEIGNLSQLVYLNCRRNQLNGTLPPEIGNLTHMIYINCSQNWIEGDIPSEIGNLIYLQSLYLNDNSFSGAIPSETGNLKDLRFLILKGNMLVGSIPESVMDLANLKQLSIGYNALYTDNENIQAFLDHYDAYWDETQTIAAEDVFAFWTSDTSIEVSWTPILYISDCGGYWVYYSTTPDGPYSLYDATAGKTIDHMEVTGLDPGTHYYFKIQTRTGPHSYNQNTVRSEYSEEVSVDTVETDSERISSNNDNQDSGSDSPAGSGSGGGCFIGLVS